MTLKKKQAETVCCLGSIIQKTYTQIPVWLFKYLIILVMWLSNLFLHLQKAVRSRVSENHREDNGKAHTQDTKHSTLQEDNYYYSYYCLLGLF